MISTLLAEHAFAVRIGFFIAVVVALAIGWFLHRRGARTTLLVLAVLGLFGALVLAMSPEGDRANGISCTVQFSIPFQGLETLANIAMLLPTTLFLALAMQRPLIVLVGVSGVSVLIELVQALAPALGRACDTNDWLMNTLGALIGALGATAILAIGRRRARLVSRR